MLWPVVAQIVIVEPAQHHAVVAEQAGRLYSASSAQRAEP
jgi:hypothetical protein